MNPQDDPEARIRDLERSAAEYGAVELGASQYSDGTSASPPPPLPPPVYGAPTAPMPPYGSPYGAPPSAPYGAQPYGSPYDTPMYGAPFTPSSKKGSPIGLIVGLVAVMVLVIGGAIAVYVWNMTAERQVRHDASDRLASGRHRINWQSPRSGSNSPTGLPGIPDAPTETTAPSGGQFSVSGVEENKTIACNDSNVNVSGVNNVVTITGHCLSLTVSGVDNEVTIDSADTIGASGFDNHVSYRSGAPEINATGSNVVEQG